MGEEILVPALPYQATVPQTCRRGSPLIFARSRSITSNAAAGANPSSRGPYVAFIVVAMIAFAILPGLMRALQYRVRRSAVRLVRASLPGSPKHKISRKLALKYLRLRWRR